MSPGCEGFVRVERIVLAPAAEKPKNPVPTPSVVSVLAGLTALVGYVYVLGGLALYRALWHAGLPAGDAVDDFSSRRFLVVGLPVAVGAGVVFALVYTAALYLWRDPLKRNERRRTRLVLAVASTLLAAAAAAFTYPLLWPLKLRLANVTTRSEGCIAGAFISSDSVGVHLADGKGRELRTIAAAQVVDLKLLKKPQPVSAMNIGECKMP